MVSGFMSLEGSLGFLGYRWTNVVRGMEIEALSDILSMQTSH